MSAVQVSGKCVVVTGATSGIGRATALMFAQRGARVCATGRNKKALAALLGEMGGGTQHCIVAGDLTQPGTAEMIIAAADKSLGGITTLVNCAGVLKGGAFGTPSCNLENLMYNFEGNTKSVFEMIEHATPALKIAGASQPACASIINVSSVNGLVSFGGVGSYCISKAAVDMMTKCAAVDLAPFGIRVNSVNPGVVMTELQKRGGLDEESYGKFIDRSVTVTHPLASSLGRVASSEEVAELILFLASDSAKFITGDNIKIDGGRGCVGSR